MTPAGLTFLGGADELSRCATALAADAGSRLAAKPSAPVSDAPGAGPALSFGKNRRAGVMGASLIQIDPERRDAVRASAWIEVVP